MSGIENKIYSSEGGRKISIEERKEQIDAIAKGKEEVDELQEEIGRYNNIIDEEFEKFKNYKVEGSLSPYPDEFSRQRNLSIEHMKDGKLRVKSYGESCDLDLKTGKIYYIKGGERIEVQLLETEKFLGDGGGLSILVFYAFGKMDIINRAMALAKVTNKTDFYFAYNGYSQSLLIGTEEVATEKILHAWFTDKYENQDFLDMFNRLTSF